MLTALFGGVVTSIGIAVVVGAISFGAFYSFRGIVMKSHSFNTEVLLGFWLVAFFGGALILLGLMLPGLVNHGIWFMWSCC